MDALTSVEYLKSLQKHIKIASKQRDITKLGEDTIKNVNIVITDLPYGDVVNWRGNIKHPLDNLFENGYNAIDLSNSVVIIVADKNTKLQNERFKQVQKFKVGKRQICFFKP
ncbi:hypothetical protein AB1K32_26165 [Metabacillus dongyingensis]|uniref:hypothetical protein n=1 Tax=Metabacillus dongyingensis TaxID=2874282 RepID=UPI003B8BC21A